MVERISIQEFKNYAHTEYHAVDENFMIATFPVSDGISFNLVYRTDNGNIIQGYFDGVDTDLFFEYEGETKSGKDEYTTIINKINDGSLVRLLRNLPSSLLLSDGKTEAHFW